VLSRHFIDNWIRANSSAAESTVKVLVATTDRLTKPRLQQPAGQSTASASPADETPPATVCEPAEDVDPSVDNPSGRESTGPATPLTVHTGTAGGVEEEDDVESPVSLWISPSPTGPHSPLSGDQHSAAFSASKSELQAADVDAHAVMDVMEELLNRVSESGAQQASALGQSSGIGNEDFQFEKLPNASVPAVPSVWPLGPPDCPQQYAFLLPLALYVDPCISSACLHSAFEAHRYHAAQKLQQIQGAYNLVSMITFFGFKMMTFRV
jgi:hypothetical protein